MKQTSPGTKLLALPLALSLFAASAKASQYNLDLQWYPCPQTGNWYALTHEAMSFFDAEGLANNLGGYLATVQSEQENTWIRQTFADGGEILLGFTDQASEGNFVWSNGEPTEFEHWAINEPNDSGSGEDYTQMNPSGDWNDISYSSLRRAVIEVPIEWKVNPESGRWYARTPGQMSWHNAEAMAVSWGGHLVDIRSLAENAWICAEFDPIAYWIGGTDEGHEEHWVWSSGVVIDLALQEVLWGQGEPNGGTSENHMEFQGWSCTWNDLSSGDLRYGLVELSSDVSDCDGNGVPDLYEVRTGVTVDDNSNGVPDICELLVESYCDCGPVATCSNYFEDGGCKNSTGWGAVLTGSGTTSVFSDDLVLRAESLPHGMFGLIFMGAAQMNAPFGDGRRCVAAGNIGTFRYGLHLSTGGAFQEGPGMVAFSESHFPAAGHLQPGQVWNFQGWYRDPGGPCGQAFNLTNAVEVTFVP